MENFQKPKVAFVCVHNSCRSQIAEALGKHFASDIFESFSAGTAPSSDLNEDAIRLVRQRYGIDMALDQHPKLLSSLPEPIDVVITMGCNVECPSIPAPIRLDWGLEDPTGQDDDVFVECIEDIERNIKQLAHTLS